MASFDSYLTISDRKIRAAGVIDSITITNGFPQGSLPNHYKGKHVGGNYNGGSLTEPKDFKIDTCTSAQYFYPTR